MPGHECYHCKQWVQAGEAHDCWTTTEAQLTQDLSDDLREAWERLRETAAEFGEQRVYASHHCIMFSRKACYFFVRPKRSALELVFFLGRTITAPQIRRTERPSQRKVAHIVHVRHRDEIEAPLTEWIREAYEVSNELSGRGAQQGSFDRADARAQAAKESDPRRSAAAKKARTRDATTGTRKKAAQKKPAATKPTRSTPRPQKRTSSGGRSARGTRR